MSPAPKPMMRYRTMVNWLGDEGIKESEVRKLIDAGIIKQGYLRMPKENGKKVRAYYSAAQIQKDVLNNGTAENAERSTPNIQSQK